MRILQTFLTWLVVVAAVCASGCVKETEKFEAKVKATINPDELQAWATNVIASATFQASDSFMVKESDIPEWVGLIYKNENDPGKVSVERSSGGNFVQILYGGGFGHWGLAIGSPTLILTNHDSCYNKIWKPGIYFWSCQ